MMAILFSADSAQLHLPIFIRSSPFIVHTYITLPITLTNRSKYRESSGSLRKDKMSFDELERGSPCLDFEERFDSYQGMTVVLVRQSVEL